MTDRYAKGARYERKAKRELEEDGWIAIRSGASKGPYDIWAVKTRLIQVKAASKPRSWTGEIEKLRMEVRPGAGLSVELWVWNKGGPWEKHEVSDEHPVG